MNNLEKIFVVAGLVLLSPLWALLIVCWIILCLFGAPIAWAINGFKWTGRS